MTLDQAAAQISGVTFQPMSEMGHFPMSEDPELFIEYVLPVLDSIADASPVSSQAQ